MSNLKEGSKGSNNVALNNKYSRSSSLLVSVFYVCTPKTEDYINCVSVFNTLYTNILDSRNIVSYHMMNVADIRLIIEFIRFMSTFTLQNWPKAHLSTNVVGLTHWKICFRIFLWRTMAFYFIGSFGKSLNCSQLSNCDDSR